MKNVIVYFDSAVMNGDGSVTCKLVVHFNKKNEMTIKGTINSGFGIKIYEDKKKAPEFVKLTKESVN